jgi:hypothetical protein
MKSKIRRFFHQDEKQSEKMQAETQSNILPEQQESYPTIRQPIPTSLEGTSTVQAVSQSKEIVVNSNSKEPEIQRETRTLPPITKERIREEFVEEVTPVIYRTVEKFEVHRIEKPGL